jgi:hypothetical protein
MKSTLSGPIKRHESLKELSRDHHFSLLLCWKIKEGVKKAIALQRIKRYTDHFYEEHLLPHFSIEEMLIFPLLGDDHPLIKKALGDHARLKGLFEEKEASIEQFLEIVTELSQHVRFEERELFNELQQTLSPHKLAEIHVAHDEGVTTAWPDEFWQ